MASLETAVSDGRAGAGNEKNAVTGYSESQKMNSGDEPSSSIVEESSFSPLSDREPLGYAKAAARLGGLSPKDVRTANESLVEKILAGVGMDEDRFATFKVISIRYRQGLINVQEYLSYIKWYGLSHLVFDLASLCPDPPKQKELIDAYNADTNDKEEDRKGK